MKFECLLKIIKKKLSKTEKLKYYYNGGGGLCTTEELQSDLFARLDFQEKIAKAKLKCHCSTHKSDMLALPDVLRVNKVTHEHRLENSMILFTDYDYVMGVIADIPSNDDALDSIKGEIRVT